MKSRYPKISLLITLLTLCITPILAYAQETPTDEEAAAGCAICGGVMMIMIIAGVVGLAVVGYLAYLTYNDAKSRGENPILWTLLVVFFNLPAFLVYWFLVRKGDLIVCEACGKKKLDTMEYCPHCQGDLMQQ